MMPITIRMLGDGSGRICTHWVFEDPEGPMQTISQTFPTGSGPVLFKGGRWRCACMPQRTTFNGPQEGRYVQFTHTNDPRAATCPKCCATTEYKDAMARYANLQTQGV